MHMVEVPCPHCGAKLKAPEGMAGKKARCNKCHKSFRLPGVPLADSVGDADIPMAEAVEEPPAAPPPPAKPVAALPSADPFDFGKPAAKSSPAVPAAKPASSPVVPAVKPKPAAAPEPARPAAKSSPAVPAVKPASSPAVPAAKPAPSAPAKSTPAAAALPAKPAVAAATPAPAAPVAKPLAKQAEPLSLDDDPPPAAPKPALPAAPVPEPPRAVAVADVAPVAEEPSKPAKSKRQHEDEERPVRSKKRHEDEESPARGKRHAEEDERPAKSKRHAEEEPARPPKSKRSAEGEAVADAPRKKRRSDEDSDARLAQAKPAVTTDEPSNPFASLSASPEPEPPKARRKRRDEDEDEDDPKARKRRRDEDEDEEPEKPRYRRPGDQPESKKMLYIVAAFGVFALILGIVAVVVFIRVNRKPEPEAKKEEPPPAIPADPPKVDSPKVDPPKVDPPKVDPKSKDKIDPKVEPKVDPPKVDPKGDPKINPKVNPKVEPKLTRFALRLPPSAKTFTVGGLPAKVEPADRPSREAGGVRVLESASGVVRRVFPPLKPTTADTYVLIQTAPPVGGKGEKLALDSYGPAGNRVPTARIDFDGDGTPNPVADVHTSTAESYFLAAASGKIHVWLVNGKKKLTDTFDPYADKPEHAKAGLAAAFFAKDPNFLVTISTAGAVHLFDLRTNATVSEFVPPHGAPGKVVLGLSAARAEENKSVAVAVGGILYQISTEPGLDVIRKYDLEGDVGRSLGLAVSSTPGRLLYAFELAPDKDGKKERAVLGLPLGDSAKHILYRLPSDAGDPKGALWAGETFGGVIVDRGVLWFDDHEHKFLPVALTQPPGVGQYFGDERYFWYVVPHPGMGGKSMLVALSVPFDDFRGYQENYFAKQPLRALRLDHTGLAK